MYIFIIYMFVCTHTLTHSRKERNTHTHTQLHALKEFLLLGYKVSNVFVVVVAAAAATTAAAAVAASYMQLNKHIHTPTHEYM